MNDFRPEDFDQTFGQLDPQRSYSEDINRMTDAASQLTVPGSGEEQNLFEFETTDEMARKPGLGLFHLRVVAFVIR